MSYEPKTQTWASARFLTLEKCSPEFGPFRLPLEPTGVMDVWTANYERQRRIMATFTIDSENNIVAHTGRPAGADESQSFSTPRELAKLTAEWPASRLVDTWNSFAGVAPFDDLKPVKKFTDRKAAVARIFKAVERLSPDAAPQAMPVGTERTRSKKSPAKASRRARTQKDATEARTNKKAEVIAMMKRPKGATLPEINGSDRLAEAHGPRLRQHPRQQGWGEDRVVEER
jgi:hypothetical protein